MDPVMPAITGGEKRIIIEHAGTHQIIGLATELPPSLSAVDAEGRPGVMHLITGDDVPLLTLVRVTPYAAFYRVPCEPKSYGSFNPVQR